MSFRISSSTSAFPIVPHDATLRFRTPSSSHVDVLKTSTDIRTFLEDWLRSWDFDLNQVDSLIQQGLKDKRVGDSIENLSYNIFHTIRNSLRSLHRDLFLETPQEEALRHYIGEKLEREGLKKAAAKLLANAEDEGGRRAGKPRIRKRRLAAFHKVRQWPDGRVPYRLTHNRWAPIILEGMRLIEENSGVRFVKVDKNSEEYKQGNCVDIIFNSNGKSQATVGRVGSEQIINFDERMLNSELGLKIVTHELLHTLGALHEHQRPDRERHVKVPAFSEISSDSSWQKIYDVNYKGYTYKQFINRSLLTPYDVHSVMQYPDIQTLAAVSDQDRSADYYPTALSWTADRLKSRFGDSGLSRLDLIGLHKMYPSSTPEVITNVEVFDLAQAALRLEEKFDREYPISFTWAYSHIYELHNDKELPDEIAAMVKQTHQQNKIILFKWKSLRKKAFAAANRLIPERRKQLGIDIDLAVFSNDKLEKLESLISSFRQPLLNTRLQLLHLWVKADKLCLPVEQDQLEKLLNKAKGKKAELSMQLDKLGLLGQIPPTKAEKALETILVPLELHVASLRARLAERRLEGILNEVRGLQYPVNSARLEALQIETNVYEAEFRSQKQTSDRLLALTLHVSSFSEPRPLPVSSERAKKVADTVFRIRAHAIWPKLHEVGQQSIEFKHKLERILTALNHPPAVFDRHWLEDQKRQAYDLMKQWIVQKKILNQHLSLYFEHIAQDKRAELKRLGLAVAKRAGAIFQVFERIIARKFQLEEVVLSYI